MDEFDFWVETTADKAHCARERQKARVLRASTWWQRRLQAGCCEYCGQNFPKKELTMDHRVPIARGGYSTKGNVVVACKTCNNNKKLMTPVELILKRY